MGCMCQQLSSYNILMSLADGPDKGIIPLTCSELFVRVADKTTADPNISFTVEVSYIEVRRDTSHFITVGPDKAGRRYITRKSETC